MNVSAEHATKPTIVRKAVKPPCVPITTILLKEHTVIGMEHNGFAMRSGVISFIRSCDCEVQWLRWS